MTKIIFELTMPNVGSWDGKFTGAKNKYTVLSKLLKKDDHSIIGKNWYYDFGDGWGANINCRLANKGEKPTNKFMGYEWMLKSIKKHGKIIKD